MFGQTSLSAYKLGTFLKVSDELLNDSVFDLPSYIATEFARRIGNKEEEAFFRGRWRRQAHRHLCRHGRRGNRRHRRQRHRHYR